MIIKVFQMINLIKNFVPNLYTIVKLYIEGSKASISIGFLKDYVYSEGKKNPLMIKKHHILYMYVIDL